MEENFPNWSDYPETFQKEVFAKIFSLIKTGKSFQLIGPTGSGKTVLLKILNNSPHIVKYHIQDRNSTSNFIYLDLNLIPEKTSFAVLKLLYNRITKKETSNMDSASLLACLETEIEEHLRQINKIVICIDYAEKVDNPEFHDLFNSLDSLYNQNRKRLIFVFACNTPSSSPDKYIPAGEFAYDLAENKIFISALSKEDSIWFIETLSRNYGIKIQTNTKNEIYSLTGGYMATIKRVVEILASGRKLNEIINFPQTFTRLNFHLQTLLDDLNQQQTTLRNVVLGNISNANEEHLEYLNKISLFGKDGGPLNKVFYEFIKYKFAEKNVDYETLPKNIKVSVKLTANEFKALNYLVNNLGLLVKRDEIIEQIWGDKAVSGISNHALDQLMHRLRNKLEQSNSEVKIVTVWGRGHKAVSTK